MSEKNYVCPYCNQKEVEHIEACGSSNYFCNKCKKLISNRVMREFQATKKAIE